MKVSEIEYVKNRYKEGLRIVCDYMTDDPRPIESGTKGTIICVDDMGSIHVKWDNGRTLALLYDVDRFHLIEEE